MQKRWLIAGALALAFAGAAHAQTYRDSGGTVSFGVVPLVGCSSSGYCAGPASATNPLPVSGTFSASLSGFAPGGAYATLSASATSSRVALPAGAIVVVYNTGSSAAYAALGGASVAATTANDVIQPGGWMAFTVGSNSYLAAITASGTTSLNLSGGSGLPTGAGGGGAGGSVSVSSLPADVQPSTQTISAADSASTSTGVANGQTFITGTPTANSAASFALSSAGAVDVEVTGTWTGTLASEISIDGGATWVSQGLHQIGTSSYTSSFTARFAGALNVSGHTQFRVRATAWTSGAATVLIRSSLNGYAFYVAGSNGVPAMLGATNGWTPLRLSALSTTVQSVKASAGELGMLQCYNPNSSQIYVQIFNAASGSVTLGTTAPTLSIAIAPTSTGGWALANPGVNFSSAISLAATTSSTGSAAPSTAPDCNAVFN